MQEDVEDSEEEGESFLQKQEDFERDYNFRFEEPGAITAGFYLKAGICVCMLVLLVDGESMLTVELLTHILSHYESVDQDLPAQRRHFSPKQRWPEEEKEGRSEGQKEKGIF